MYKSIESICLDNIIANIPHFIFWKNTNSEYLGCNDNFAKSVGLADPNDIIGKTDNDLPWRNSYAKIYLAEDKEIIKTGKRIIDKEVPFVDSEGQKKIILVNKIPLLNETEEIIGLLGMYSDITQQKEIITSLRQAKEQAELANNAKTEFLHNMRHDVRTPLTGIIGFANVIKEEATNPKIGEYADNLIASGHALLDFLNEILEIIRVSSGEIPLLKKKFQLDVRLNHIIDLNLAKAKEKRLTLKLNYDDKIPKYLLGDPRRVHRIILELVTNALNFTEKGHVIVNAALAKEDDFNVIVRISVEDTGIGIPPNKKDEIFARFKRMAPSYDGIYKGAGIGLTVIKQFIDDINGEIYVESNVNVGSTFVCLLPFKKSLLEDDTGVEVDDFNVSTPSKKVKAKVKTVVQADSRQAIKASANILLVEDQELAAKVASHLLNSIDCNVDVAKTGREGIQKIVNNQYDLVFLDVGLPDMSGFDVAQQIRFTEIVTNTHIPIIALTAHVDTENKQECIEAGMDAVLSKPLSKSVAIDILNAFIPSRAKKLKVSEIEQAKATSQITKKLSGKVVDLELGTELMSGDKQLAIETLTSLIKSFPEDLQSLTSAYEQQDWYALKNAVHKLRGGVCYCGAPRLKEACIQLENYLMKGQVKEISTLYQQLIAEINALQDAVNKL